MPLAAERLAAHDRADHRTVDIEIAHPRLSLNQARRPRHAAVQATRIFAQSKQGATDLTVQGIVSLLPAALQPQHH